MDDKAKLTRRLSIVKGQLDGIIKMMGKEDLKCLDVFIQIKAAKQGLDTLGKELLKLRLKECISQSSKGADEEIDELIKAIS